jgi:CRP/FNR family nitrogen fixation transcriptional regulator
MLMQRTVASGRTVERAKPGMPVGSHSLAGAFEMMGAAISYHQNHEIYGEGEPADFFYKVVSGAVRVHKITSDGRRQISAFHLPGDVFGLEASDEHRFTAEAVADSTVLVVKRGALTALAARDSEVAAELWVQTAADLWRAQEHMLLLGRKTAHERVAAFLLDIASRAAAEEAVDLPMSRQDIADYLGLTIETVSRTLTQLEGEAAIALPSCRHVVLSNRAALNRLNS